LERYAHWSPTHLWKAVEGLAEFTTGSKTGSGEVTVQKPASQVMERLVSRLGLEPRALALKGRCSTD
jgi:hypothetical protein